MRLFNLRKFGVVILSGLLLSVLFTSGNIKAAEETLCFTEKIENSSSFNIYTGRNDANNPIKWQHSIPPGILDSVVRVGLYIEAWDVDYPANDEHDRVYFNGYDLGLLEGVNDTWITVEKTIPVTYLKSGINNLEVAVDELNKGWKVSIRSSELRFYCSSPEPDFSIGGSPSLQKISAGAEAVYKVVITALNGFNSPVAISVSGLPSGFTAVFTDNPVTPNGETEMTISTPSSAAAGKYSLKIKGESGELVRDSIVILQIEESPCPGFKVETKAKPVKGMAPLLVDFRSAIINGTGIDSDYSYLWDFDDGTTSDAVNVTHIFNDPGKYRVKLKVTDKCGSVREKSELVEVKKVEIDCEKNVDKISAKPGDVISYKIKVTNLSDLPLKNMEVKDSLSDELELISESSELNFTKNGNILTWKGSLDALSEFEAEIKVKIRYSVLNGTIIANTASVKDPLLAEEIISNTVQTIVDSEPVSTSKIKFIKRSENPASRIGQMARFRLQIINNSEGTLLNTIVEDQLPPGFSYVTGSTLINGGRSSDPEGKRRLTWSLSSIYPGESVTIRFQTVISADAKRGRNINRAYLSVIDSTGQKIRMEDSDFINVSSDGMIFYSGVRGTVYLDKDKNGFFSYGDIPVEGIEVRLSTGESSVSGEDGAYSFAHLFPGEYAIGINRARLPEKYKLLSPYPVPVFLSDGLTDTKDFALLFSGDDPEISSRFEGIVFFDKNRNFRFDAGDIPADEFKVTIDNTLSARGKSGKFLFNRLEPGKHLISIKYGSKEIELEVVLAGGNQEIEFPLVYTGIKVIVTGEK